jgi:hypothetical protein
MFTESLYNDLHQPTDSWNEQFKLIYHVFLNVLRTQSTYNIAIPKMSSLSALSALADKISKSAKTIEKFLQENNLPEPSFDADGPKAFPVGDQHPEILAARDELIDSTQELRDLVVGPTDTIKWRTMTVCRLRADSLRHPPLLTIDRTTPSRLAYRPSIDSR